MSDVTISKRRFIAGAVCPACSELDTIQDQDAQPDEEAFDIF